MRTWIQSTLLSVVAVSSLAIASFLAVQKPSIPLANMPVSPILLTSQLGTISMSQVKFTTNLGSFTLELNAEKAPKTVANFLQYVKAGHYDDTIFHRVINNFMVQGGGFDANMNQKAAAATVENEADNGLKNDLYTVAMARTSDPHSASAQFFVNVKNNDFLNFSSRTNQGWGYAVFGKVIDGTDVIDKMTTVPTGNRAGHSDVPREAIIIESVKVL
jgi:peptidyl-prolyl cis-trans isomerase B (cyclophilin B)